MPCVTGIVHHTMSKGSHYHKTSQNAPRTNLIHLVMPSFSSALMHITMFFSYMLLCIGTVPSLHVLFHCLSLRFHSQCSHPCLPFRKMTCITSGPPFPSYCTSQHALLLHSNGTYISTCPHFTDQWYMTCPPL